ncbi:ubiquitin carboxyl-terminal hydrolase 7-like [Glossina fuscipes]|uniref:Ubiquitin carboxyl-terminal hydrolase 7 n=1 Tax=Glossina fuscipes TaxID=7396 RepID=A0A8U0WFZ0_9MUSC|nr:ubiquitin carboxyl-terminal hydrolase 7-like [Glossina fuscipes]KAI9590568.1 hypothetical protein GQX74_008735 [Glossina fuscipes]
MADDGADPFRSEATFSYTVENIVQLKRQQLSPPFFVRMLPWKIKVIPKERTLGFFLECNGDDDSPTWYCNAIAELRIKSHKAGTKPFIRIPIKHLFCSEENDYGYCNYISWRELQNPGNYFLCNGAITLEVYVRADEPRGVQWNSKQRTDYVGLKGQGSICCMNSFLQSIYFINELRRIVYKIPTEADNATDSVGLALQYIFYELQFSDNSVGTEKLTESFGLKMLHFFTQYDVQKFSRTLFDELESKIKGTNLEGTVTALFKGKMFSYTKCKNVDYSSTRYETFYDIQLNVKGKKDIMESFQDYIAPINLHGDNKYDSGYYGLQEANKCVNFISFPSVLHLHLMRFQYDPVTNRSIKYNDRFQFYEQINLDQFMEKEDNTKATYALHAVLAHSDDNHGGHYVVFINPKCDGKWYKFDDDVVCSCKKLEAIELNYGGIDDEISVQADRKNACMLVYVRKSEINRILSDISDHEIPRDLIERLDLEKQIETAHRKVWSELHLYVSVHIILEEDFELQEKCCLFDLHKTRQRLFKFKQTQSIEEMMNQFVKSFCVPKERMRVWIMYAAKAQKFFYFDFQRERHRTVGQIPNPQKPWVIFLELAPPDKPGRALPSFDSKKEVLIFFKFYDARNKRFNYISYSQQPLARRLIEILPDVNAVLGFDLSTKLSVFDEGNNSKFTDLNETIENILLAHKNKTETTILQGFVLVFEKEYIDSILSNEPLKTAREEAGNDPSPNQTVEDHPTLAVVDCSDCEEDSVRVNWWKVECALNKAYFDILAKNPGAPPKCRTAGWYRGRLPLTACADQRSADLFKQAIDSLGEVWPNAKLEAVPLKKLINTLRSHTLIPAEPHEPQKILNLIKVCNPQLPTISWEIAKVGKVKKGSREVTILLNKESLPHLDATNKEIFYGFTTISLDIFENI